MSYGDYLKKTLKPLGIYELDSGIGALELEVEGAVLDGIQNSISDTVKNMLPATADENGINQWGRLIGIRPVGADIAAKRSSVMGLMRLGECECSDQGLNYVLDTCGIPAAVSESATKETVRVTIFENHLEDGEEEKIKALVEAILPCHLDVVYAYA